MKKTIILQNHEIPYLLRRSGRTRGMRLSIKTDCEVVVTAHSLIPEFIIRQFLKQKATWIIEKVEMMKARNKDKIQITDKKQKQEIRDKAIVSVLTKVKKWNEGLGYEVAKITIKEQKTCWGSCTRDRHLNFNWKLGLMPDHLVDYVVVHELCHLKHFDHSKKFWELVSTMVPDYKARRRELNAKGLMIT
ncbi:M48 family metallopeptidase [soil metagenome]